MKKAISRLRGKLLVPCCVLAIAAAVVLIGCFIQMVAVQTSWKRDLQTLERQFSRAYGAGAALSREATEETVLAGSRDLNYFLRVLNLPGSMATHSGKRLPRRRKTPGRWRCSCRIIPFTTAPMTRAIPSASAGRRTAGAAPM